MFKILAIFLVFCSYNADGKQFRSDYKYYPNAMGWLKLHQVPANWHEARLRCHLEGAVLASPLDEKVLEAIKAHMSTNNAQPCGIFSGVHSTFSRGDYSSVEGFSLASMSITWAPNEPDNFEDSEGCLIFLPNGTMADVKCNEVFPYICYRKSNLMIMTGCGTIDSQYYLDDRTGSCYKFHTKAKPWSRAYMTCMAEGGHLAIINSDTEAQVLEELFAKYPKNKLTSEHKDSAVVGIQDWGEHGTWLTIHGEELEEAGYNKWQEDTPNNRTGTRGTGAFCGCIGRSGKFHDMGCDDILSFICEKNRDSLFYDAD